MKIDKKYFGRYKEALTEMPDLVEPQLHSFNQLIESGLKEVFEEFSPIRDYAEKKFELSFTHFELSKPKYDEHYAKSNKLSYEGQLKAKVKLKNKLHGSEKEQEMFLADFPLMTSHGTFIINVIERVIVPQLARSFGIFFTSEETKGKNFFGAKIIPARGAWIEIETDTDGVIHARIDRKRKFAVTSLLRVLGAETDEAILALFKGNEEARKAIELTLAKDHAKTIGDAYIEIHKRLRDGDLATADNAREFVGGIFKAERYDLSKVGRFRFNKRFEKKMDEKELERKTIDANDLSTTIAHIVYLNNTPDATEDDIDHLGSRRVRFVGELLQQKIRVGMTQMKRNIQDKMSTVEPDVMLPVNFVFPRPLQARIKEFFTTNQLSQFMLQENALAEVEHLRTLSALGSGGTDSIRLPTW
jgi:DNA-directed RNA polymerase subunit beta